ncbi:MAG: Hpt domain-containing protein [Novosphingobium sp.]|nr:Hpt domain-containing protein [Novosphingobium sp.]
MAFEYGSLDATLAAAAGDDPALLRELRAAFRESLENHVDLLSRARCDGNWNMALMRLRGLACSFHVDELIALTDEAQGLAPNDPTVVRRVRAMLDDFPRD